MPFGGSPANRKGFQAVGHGAVKPTRSTLNRAIELADQATGASQFASGALWSATHPIDRLTGKGRAAHQSMEVPWVAGRPWFHGSSRVFEKPDPAKANPHSLYGPGHYITDDPSIASTYTTKGEGGVGNRRVSRHPPGGRLKDRVARARADLEAEGLTVTGVRRAAPGDQHVLLEFQPRDYGPNVTRYGFEPDKVFDVREPITPQATSRLVDAIRGIPPEPNPRGGIAMGNVRRADLTHEVQQLASQRANAMNALWGALENTLGAKVANDVIRRAGYDAIAYPGGAMTGGRPHNALVVLNDALLQRGGIPNPRYAGTPRPTR